MNDAADDELPPQGAEELEHPVFIAGLNLLSRTGASGIQIRCSAEDQPVVWLTVIQYASPNIGEAVVVVNGNSPPEFFYETASGLSPIESVMRLCNEVLGGSSCNFCSREVRFRIFNTTDMSQLSAPDDKVCVVAWNPYEQQFQPSCRQRV